MRSRLFLLVSVLSALLTPSVGRAWTRAHVREAHARIELSEQRPAQVQLDLVVDVQGGWLERLELAGLEEDMVLSDEPAQVTLESGEQLAAKAVARAGTVTLKFERRDGLRRGLHQVRVRYATDLAGRAHPVDGGRVQLSWTLPGWEAGLLGADITVVGARGLTPVEVPDVAQEVRLTEEAGRQTLRFARIHVPRGSPWRVAWELPGDSLRGGARADTKRDVLGSNRHWQVGAMVALLTGLLVTGARLHVRRRLAQRGLQARGWLRGHSAPTWLLWLLSIGVGATWVPSLSVALTLVIAIHLLGVEGAGAPLGPLPLGAFVPMRSHERRALMRSLWRERVGLPWADLSSALGALGVAGLLTAVALDAASLQLDGDAWGYVALIGVLAWLCSARLRLPRSMAEQVAMLVREAERTRVVSCALNLVWYVTGERREQPRLRLTPSARYPGLLRMEVLVDTRRGAAPFVLSVLASSDSAVERWTRALFPQAFVERSPGSSRVAIMVPVDELSRSVECVLEHFTVQSGRLLSEPLPARAA